MKILLKFKTIAMITVLSIAFYSCSQDEIETVEQTSQDELYKDAVELEGETVFSMEYDENLTEEEASAQFDKDFKQFLKNNPSTQKAARSTEWFYSAAIRVGPQTGNTSTGRILSRVYFKTSRGTSWVAHYHGNGFATQPGWRYTMFRGWYPGNLPVSFVKPLSHQITVSGNDALFLTHLNVHIASAWQSIPASGSAGVRNTVYQWLQNTTFIIVGSPGQYGSKVTF